MSTLGSDQVGQEREVGLVLDVRKSVDVGTGVESLENLREHHEREGLLVGPPEMEAMFS